MSCPADVAHLDGCNAYPELSAHMLLFTKTTRRFAQLGILSVLFGPSYSVVRTHQGSRSSMLPNGGRLLFSHTACQSSNEDLQRAALWVDAPRLLTAKYQSHGL
jgi:hypothetical protein